MSTDLVQITIPGTSAPILAADQGGRHLVPIKPVCDAIGVDADSQRRKLDQSDWATTVLVTVVAADGKQREMVAIDADHLPMWLATIQVGRVSPDARPTLIAFQREAAKALRDYFYRGVAVAPAQSQFDILRAAIDQLEAAERTANEAKAIATDTRARLDAIEGRHDWYAALGYARLTKLPDTSAQSLRRLGVVAGQIAKRQSIEAVSVPHHLYGTVNSFPRWVWDAAVDQAGAG